MQEPPLYNPWLFSVADLMHKLKTTEAGLSDAEAAKRLTHYGTNTFRNTEKNGAARILAKQFGSPLIYILVGAAVVTGILREWIDVSVIALAIVINVVLGFTQEYRAEQTLDKLTDYIRAVVRVIRAGRERELDAELLVIGDIIHLMPGSKIPADVRLISVNNLHVDETILTGESLPIEKRLSVSGELIPVTARANMVHAGTLVVDGFGQAIVTATGNATEIGHIANVVSQTRRANTPLQQSIGSLSWIIFLVVCVITVGVFLLGLSSGVEFFEMLLLSAAIAVGAVPESLPIAMTVILAIGAQRIATHGGIVRKLGAAETLGSVTLILTDKTGTLTQANMALVGILERSDLLSDSTHTTDHIGKLTAPRKRLLQYALHNINVVIADPNLPMGDQVLQGKPFEVNIARIALQHGLELDQAHTGHSTLLLPFNSQHKFSVSASNDGIIVMGAPDILLERSSMSKDDYLRIHRHITQRSEGGQRLIAICKMSHTAKHSANRPSTTINPASVKDLEFLGVFAFYDPIRDEVPGAIAEIQNHGIRVVMVTGDLRGTALHVAQQLGWNVSANEVVDGSELAALSDSELLQVLPHIKVFARTTPNDKLRIATGYKQLGEIVAMTGDGVNDAPALKAVDIGLALGSGSDVARSVADLVLLDDNFTTIGFAVVEGRRILSNIRKTCVYLLSNSLDEVILIGGSLIAGLALPLTALQIIWVNLCTGSLPALAFAFDKTVDRPMHSQKSSHTIFNREVRIMILGIGIISSILLFVLYYGLIRYGVDVPIARSIIFVCFSSYILAVAYSFRSLSNQLFTYNPFSNRKLNYSILIGAVILIATMSSPFLRDIFQIAPLPLSWLWLIIVWILFNVMLVEIAKYLLRKYR